MKFRDTHWGIFLHDFLPVLEEILVEYSILCMRGFEHCAIETGHLLGLGRKIDRFAYQLSEIWKFGGKRRRQRPTIVLHFDVRWKRFIW